MDIYSDNPLYADPLFTPASTAMRSGMRGNSLFEETQAADVALFTGGTAYGSPGFGAFTATPRSGPQQRQPGGFDPDPRLFDPAAGVRSCGTRCRPSCLRAMSRSPPPPAPCCRPHQVSQQRSWYRRTALLMLHLLSAVADSCR